MRNAREPGREFASWTLALVLLFTASCSSNFSWQSQQASAVMASLALTCSSSRNHNQSNDFSMSVRGYATYFQEVADCTGTSWILSVHVYSSISKEIRLAVKCQSLAAHLSLREACLTWWLLANSLFLDRNKNSPNKKLDKKAVWSQV